VVAASASGFVTVLLSTESNTPQKCIHSLNKGDEKVKKAQDKDIGKCLKDAARARVADFNACLTADAKGKVAKARAKTCSSETRKCDPARLPDCATVNDAAQNSSLARAHDLYGNPASAPAPTSDKDGSKCQKEIEKNGAKLFQAIVKEANKAKKNALKAKPPAASGAEIQAAMTAAVVASTKIAKGRQKIIDSAAKKCEAVADLPGLYPTTACPTDSLANFTACVGIQAVCRACENINTADALSNDCAVWANGACLP
jgi:hypothetical protein